MGDMGDYWRDITPYLKKRRTKYVSEKTHAGFSNVASLGLTFTVYRSTSQFAIETSSGIIDYWGTTGTWIHRKTRKRGKGMKSLKRYLKENELI